MNIEKLLRRRITVLLYIFIIGLVISGLTAFPLEWELKTLAKLIGATPGMTVENTTGFIHWIIKVRNALIATNQAYPFISYGTDWLAFGHIVIATAFIGPLRDPVKNIWVIEWAMLACILVIPLAMICGPIRQIPFYWRLIDCSFGVFGIIPLWITRRYILELERVTNKQLHR